MSLIDEIEREIDDLDDSQLFVLILDIINDSIDEIGDDNIARIRIFGKIDAVRNQ